MSTTILVPLDGSPLTEQALPYAEWLAHATGACLLLVRASRPQVDADESESLTEADAYLKRVVGPLRAGGLAVERSHRLWLAASEILAEAAECPADLIVMATHGRSGPGRLVYGSVADGKPDPFRPWRAQHAHAVGERPTRADHQRSFCAGRAPRRGSGATR